MNQWLSGRPQRGMPAAQSPHALLLASPWGTLSHSASLESLGILTPDPSRHFCCRCLRGGGEMHPGLWMRRSFRFLCLLPGLGLCPLALSEGMAVKLSGLLLGSGRQGGREGRGARLCPSKLVSNVVAQLVGSQAPTLEKLRASHAPPPTEQGSALEEDVPRGKRRRPRPGTRRK